MADSKSPNAPPSNDRYVVVARRYRPREFGQLVGQDHVARALANAIETGRIGHAYLFTGARGVGKTSTARIFAKALNATGGPSVHPDPTSDISQAIDSGEDIDVLEIDGASNRGIDEIRQLRAGAGIRPSRARYKIYIIDEVHMLTKEAFNALLKTLEEPPEHVKFIFCTTAPEKIPITVLSRCQRFDFAPVRMEAIAGRLREIIDAEGAEADDDALRLLARRANGSMRDSQSLLEQVLAFSRGRLTAETVHDMLGTADDTKLAGLADAILAHDARSAMEQIEHALAGGVEAGQLAEQLLGYFRDMMAATVGCDAEMLRFCSPANHDRLAQQGQHIGLQTLLAVVALLDQALIRIRHSVYGQILLEAALVQICALPNLEGISRIASALTQGVGGREEKKNVKLTVGSRDAGLGAQPVSASVPQRVAGAPLSDGPSERLGRASKITGETGASAGRIQSSEVSVEPIKGVGGGPAGRQGVTEVGNTEEPNKARPDDVGGLGKGAGNEITKHESHGPRRQADSGQAESGHVQSGQGASLQRPAGESAPAGTRAEALGGVSVGERSLPSGGARHPVAVQLGAPANSVVVNPPTNTGGETKGPRPSLQVLRRQRLREFEQHERVRRVIEMFEAEIIRVDDPHLG